MQFTLEKNINKTDYYFATHMVSFVCIMTSNIRFNLKQHPAKEDDEVVVHDWLKSIQFKITKQKLEDVIVVQVNVHTEIVVCVLKCF